MNEKKTISKIKEAYKSNRLKEPFRAKNVIEACPELNPNTIPRFLWKHSNKNKCRKYKIKVYFIWIKRGLYKFKPF